MKNDLKSDAASDWQDRLLESALQLMTEFKFPEAFRLVMDTPKPPELTENQATLIRVEVLLICTPPMNFLQLAPFRNEVHIRMMKAMEGKTEAEVRELGSIRGS